MRVYFNNLTMKTWLMVMVPVVVAAYPIVRIVLPMVLRAVVPGVVRSMLGAI